MLGASACKETPFQRGEEIEVNPTVGERYQNHIEIEGQWGSSAATGADGQYGIGDPFVMRYNGKYYLYPSTSDPCDGIKVFESDDMVNWTYKGFAVSESERTVHGAYAPEVVYYNGYFYMCQSRAGKGHYIYRSESPTEGFTLISKTDGGNEEDIDYGNLGMGIDGAFYVSDDGKLYLLHTSTPAGLKYNEITDVNDVRVETVGRTKTLGDANLNHWIEGPGIIRRGDVSYLTYTGNHVTSKGYRIAYSYAENLSDLSSFVQPIENVTIIDTSDEHYGLGHSSNFNGPDLDSIYTAYHSLVGRGPARRYNLDRYLASGSLLTANGVTHRPVAMPNKPTMSAVNGDELDYSGGMYCLGEAGKYFTAEFNLIPCDGQELFFGNGYSVRLTEDGIALYKDGALQTSKDAYYAKDKLNTVRVESGDGVGHVYLNGMRLISYDPVGRASLLGYAKKDGVFYTAFTNDVFGTSDFEAVKNFPTRFPATAYLKGENRGFSIAEAEEVKGGLRVGEKQNLIKTQDAEYAVRLSTQGDWVKYAVDIPASEKYSLSARVASSTDGSLKITVGNKEHTVAFSAREGENISLGTMACEEGVTTMKVELLSGEIDLVWLDVQGDAEGNADESLAAFTRLNGAVEAQGETLTVRGTTDFGNDGVAIWGGRGMSDYEVEVDFVAKEGTTEFGFMVRANDYSYHSAQPTQSWRGYYVSVSSQIIALSRYDYSGITLSANRKAGLLDGGEHQVKITAEGNAITVFVDGEKQFTAVDPNAFLYGKFGIFVDNGQVEIKNFRFQLRG